MAATQEEIGKWFDQGVEQKATHMVVVCDTFDHDDYPVFVKPSQSAKKVVEAYDGKNMQRVMEVYDLSLSKADQLSKGRVFNYS
ncbi:hypothetical protein [Roseibium sp.]|uniref:hypothetical protein n=1 Tax=Roseibium sp. TaxID=1936156 RepID=UPI003B52A602